MKDKPPFILYSNYNKSLSSRSQSSKRFRNNVNLIFARIPKDILENSKEIKKIVFKERKPVYDIINFNKKPIEIKISNDMSDQTQKNLENINSFRENFYEFNQDEMKLLGNAASMKKENDIFGNQYHKIQDIKNKFKTGTYLDYDYLIPIASRYSAKGIKVPKINTGKSVFSGNPLILSGSELEDFIVYNLGDRKKGTKFLERLEDIMEKKENGEFISPPEMGDKPENMKGYIPPDILIPQLQNEIQSTKNTLKNIDNLDNFFKKKKSNLELFFSPDENKSKIRIKKNLSSIKRLNNKNNNNNINDSTDLSLINHLSPVSPNSSYKLNNSNDNSPTSSDKSTLFIFSKLPSNNRRKNRFSAISDLYNQKNKRKTNLPDINFVLRNIRGRVSNVNIHNNRSSLQNNSADAKSKIMSKNFLRLKYFPKNEKKEEKK